MESRVFERPTMVLSTDGKHTEQFNPGERAKNIQRIGRRVMFEPVSTHRVAGTYAMDWNEFESSTSAYQPTVLAA